LLQYHADRNALDASGKTPVMLTGPDDSGVVKLLLDAGGRVHPERPYERDVPMGPISWALLNYKTALAEGLIIRTRDVSGEDCGAVFYAAQSGATRALALLLDRHATVDVESKDGGLTPLLAAAAFGQNSVREGAAQSPRREGRRVVIHWNALGARPYDATWPLRPADRLDACRPRGHIDTVNELLRQGADVDRIDARRKTAVDYASASGHQDVVKLLRSN
jgi:ankyrin repeat protein